MLKRKPDLFILFTEDSMTRIALVVGVVGFLFFSRPAAIAQIPNPGFETWVNAAPADWFVNNVALVGWVPVTQSTTAHTGSFAVKGTVIAIAGGQVYSPTVASGATGGFTYTQRPASITGYYQFTPAAGSGDRFGINAALYKGGAGGTGICIGAAALPTAVSSWTKFTVPFQYVSGDVPDWASITFTIIGPNTSTPPKAGSTFLVDDVAFEGTATSVSVFDPTVPSAFELMQNYPNPFNPSTTFTFSIPSSSFVTLTVTDLLGREVAKVVSEELRAGRHTRQWNAANVPSGMYFYTIHAGTYTDTKKLTLMK